MKLNEIKKITQEVWRWPNWLKVWLFFSFSQTRQGRTDSWFLWSHRAALYLLLVWCSGCRCVVEEQLFNVPLLPILQTESAFLYELTLDPTWIYLQRNLYELCWTCFDQQLQAAQWCGAIKAPDRIKKTRESSRRWAVSPSIKKKKHQETKSEKVLFFKTFTIINVPWLIIISCTYNSFWDSFV